MSARWRIELLGGFKVSGSGATIDRFRTQKTAALLAYLAYHAGRAQSREVLTELLWPEDDLESARHKLSVALSSLRSQLEPQGVPDSSVLRANRHTVQLNPCMIATDVGEFEAHLEVARQAPEDAVRRQNLQTAVSIYQGSLLPGFYEDWILPEQRRLEGLYFEAGRRLIPLLEAGGDLSAAIEYAIQLVAVDRLREEHQRMLIRLYAASGQLDAALRQYLDLERLLRAEVDTEPTLETRRMVERIRQQHAAPGRVPEGPVASPPGPDGSYLTGATGTPSHAAVRARQSLVEDVDPIGGAVPLRSAFYIARGADAELERAIRRRTSVVLVKGTRQVGKTSLLARALEHARGFGCRTVHLDLQVLNSTQVASADVLLQAIARAIGEQLGKPTGAPQLWDPEDGANMNFRRLMRATIQEDPERPLVWALDDVDRLFSCSFGSEIFALLRSWHNERALDPTGPWARLTLVIAYATEAHLFIRDINQSPFNIGTRLVLEDFSTAQVRELNLRYGGPLRSGEELARFYRLVGGHPYLVRRGLLEMASEALSYGTFDGRSDHEDWIYGEHLRHLRALLTRDPELCECMRAVLRGRCVPDPAAFYRLRSAGLISGETWEEARPRCELYSRYLERHLFSRGRTDEV